MEQAAPLGAACNFWELNFLALGGDLHQTLGDELSGGHGTLILALAGTDGNGTCFHIPVTDDQHIGDLL